MKNDIQVSFPWQTLHSWYEKNGRHSLPWREYDVYGSNIDSLLYTIWLSEILLQQTQVERVIPYLSRILKQFPTISHLAETDYDTFFPYYQGMGYYSRARNILKTAKIIRDEYNSHFPTEEKLLMKLPGVGQYTASALRAFGYGIPILAWDTNLEKVFSRYMHGRKDIALTKEEKEAIEIEFQHFIGSECDIKKRVVKVRNINNALMDFGSLIDNKNPEKIQWDTYPITAGLFYETRGKHEPNIISKAIRFPTADAHIVVILHENHRLYYSSQEGKYLPFILPGVGQNNTREVVQSYFREKYNAELSVRPVHKKWMGDDNIPYIAVYAQVQAGKIKSKQYKKEEIIPDLLLYKK